MPDSGGRTLVTGALGCLGAWTLKALVDLGEEPVGFDLGSDDARLRLALSEEERARVDARRGRRHGRRGGRARARRARHHARRPPRRAAGAVLPCRPRARSPRERARDGRRLRGGQGTARPDPRPRVRELDGRLQRVRPLPRSRVRRHGALDALRRVQARERGNGARVLGRRRRRVDRHPPVRRVRAGPRPGSHLGPVARDGGRGTR